MAIITTDDLLSHMGLTTTRNDDAVTRATAAANSAVVRYCGRSFEKTLTPTARLYRPLSSTVVYVDDFWTTTGLIVETANTEGVFDTIWTAAQYQAEPLNGIENGQAVSYYRINAVDWISSTAEYFYTCDPRPNVRVTASWGWATIPDDVKMAALIKAARLYHRKDSPQGVAGFNEFVGVVQLSAQDGDVTSLLRDYRYPRRMLV